MVPFPLVPPDPSSCYCLCCILRIDRRASFFLITLNQCKKNRSRQGTLCLVSGILQPGSLLQFSCPFLQVYLNYDMQFSPSPLTFGQIANGSDSAVLWKNIFPLFFFYFCLLLPFFIPTTTLTKTSKSGVPEGVLKEASYTSSFVVKLFSYLHFSIS